MAKGQEIDELYISLGLNVDDLQLGFDTAGKTVSQSISRLNSKAKKIQLKTDVDLGKLDAAASELDKIKLKYESINQQLDIQRKKEEILANVLRNNRKQYGDGHGLTSKAEMNLLYQQKSVVALEAQLKALSTEMNKLGPKAATSFGKIGAAANDAKNKVGSLNSGFKSLSTSMAGTLATMAAAGGLFAMTDSAMHSGENLYKLSSRLHTTTGEAAKLNKVFKMAGVDINSAIPFFTRLDRQVLASGKNLNFTQAALLKYGVSLTDNKGKILPYIQQLEALSAGYLRASEAGLEEEFAIEVLGNKGQALIPILQDMGTYSEALAKVPSTGLLDPKIAHEANVEWTAMQMTLGQLNAAMGAALLPVARELMPEIQGVFASLVQSIKDNKDAIINFGKLGADAIRGINDVAMVLLSTLEKVSEVQSALGADQYASNVMDEAYGKDVADNKRTFGRVVSGIGGGAAGFMVGGPVGGIIGGGLGLMYGDDLDVALNNAWMHVMREESDEDPNTSETMWEKYSKRYENKRDALLEKELEATEDNTKAKEEDIDVTEKLTQAEQDAIEAINLQLSRETDKLYDTDLNNNLNSVDLQAEEYMKKGADEISVTEWQEAKKAKIIEDFNRDVANSIDSIWRTEYENQLSRIDQEREAWIKKGLDEVEATKWAEENKRQIQQNTVKQMFTQQKKYLDLYRKAQAEGGTEEEKAARAQNYIAAQMRKDNGISDNDWTTKSEILGFQKAMKASEVNMIPVLDDSAMQKALESYIPIIRGTTTSSPLMPTSAQMLNQGAEVIRGTNSSYVTVNQNNNYDFSNSINGEDTVENIKASAQEANDQIRDFTQTVDKYNRKIGNESNRYGG